MVSSQLIQDTKAELGEGPSWDAYNHVLYWVDYHKTTASCIQSLFKKANHL